jgi:dUTPase
MCPRKFERIFAPTLSRRMTDTYYRLELLPDANALEFYKNVTGRSDDNAGFDLYVTETCETKGGTVSLLNLGCKARMLKCFPDGTEQDVAYWLAPRSSIWKSGVTQANSIGVIDKSYRGKLMGAVIPIHKPEGYWSQMAGSGKSGSYVWMNCDSRDTGNPTIERGQRLFQIVAPDMGWIKEVRIVETLPETVRGEGAFGSSGR